MTVHDSDVVVVGAGIIGLACAWRIAQRGATVTVVDPAPTRGASHVAAGMLAPVTEVHYGEGPLLALNLESARRWPAFADELAAAGGHGVDFEEAGTLAVAYDNDDWVALAALGRYLDGLELHAQRLRSREVRALEPMLASSVRGGLWAAGDHRVDPRTVTAALLSACRRTGVRIVTERADRLDCAAPVAGRRPAVQAVMLASGERILAERVVLAAGAAARDLGGVPAGDRAPVRPVKGQILTLRGPPGDPLLTRGVRGLVEGASVYLVPRPDGRLIVGATVEEQGWDARPTAGGVYELLRDASLLVPGISECELVDTLVGFRPGTPDNAPILGPSTETSGIIHAVGHHRNGVLLTPVTADAIAEVVTTGECPEVIVAFGIDRFSNGPDRPVGGERADAMRAR